jgi:hypothetical protein
LREAATQWHDGQITLMRHALLRIELKAWLKLAFRRKRFAAETACEGDKTDDDANAFAPDGQTMTHRLRQFVARKRNTETRDQGGHLTGNRRQASSYQDRQVRSAGRIVIRL